MSFTFTLFGSFQAFYEGRTLTFATNTARALLAYLAIEANQSHRRELLAALFWPDHPQTAAYANLRQTLARVRRALPDSRNDILQTTQQTVRFNAEGVDLDVMRFDQLLAECRAHIHTDIAHCLDCVGRLQQATALYRGEFIEGLALEQGQPFAEWILFKRESLHRQMLTSLRTLTRHYELTGDYARMRDTAARQIAMEPWHEEAHAKMMIALVRQGDRAAALRQYEACCQLLMAELGMEPNRELRALRDALATEDSLIGLAASTATPVIRATHNLPNQLTSFVGRENELNEIAALLQEPAVRLITLTGIGGLGKTRLSIEVAHAQLSHFGDGAYFVSLAALSDARTIPSAIVAAIGLSLPGKDPGIELTQWLRDKHLLLVLDNFEHLLPKSAFVVALLQSAPRVKVIVTSRELLNLRGEHVYSLQGISYQSTELLAEVARLSAVRLFVQSARQTHNTFKLDANNFRAVLRICELVQGLPLGIELAAAWLRGLSLDDIAAGIIRSSDFLEHEWHDAPERHRSMRAVFNGSWHLLSSDEQIIFRQLSVFRGGFNHAAAQAVSGASLTILMRLVRKSLIRWNDASGSVGRYEIHELLRQFAAEQLDARPEEQLQVEARHSQYYLAFVAAREKRIARNEPRKAADEISAELDNIGKAWYWAATNGRLHETNQAAYTLWQFYVLKSLPSAGQAMFHQVTTPLEKLQAQPHLQPTSTEIAKPLITNVLSKLLAMEASFANTLGKHDHAILLAQHVLNMVGAGEDADVAAGREGKAIGLYVWGNALHRKGDNDKAYLLLERALLYSQQPQPYIEYDIESVVERAPIESLYDVEFITLIWLKTIVQFKNITGGHDYILRALHLCQQLQKRRGESLCLYNLAAVALDLYDFPPARPLYERALLLAQEIGYRWGETATQLELGRTLRGLGDYGTAYGLFEKARILIREVGDLFVQETIASHFAQLCCFIGDLAQAQAHLDECAQMIADYKTPLTQFDWFLASAMVAYFSEEYTQSHAMALQATQVADQNGAALNLSYAWFWVGQALRGLHQLDNAAAAYEQSLQANSAMARPDLDASPRTGLAQLAQERGDLAHAQSLVEEVLAVLAQHPRAGWDEPFEVYLTCVLVLRANHDPRSEAVLRRAQELLQDYANHIQDSRLRRAFLENVRVHHDIQATCS